MFFAVTSYYNTCLSLNDTVEIYAFFLKEIYFFNRWFGKERKKARVGL